MARRIVSPVMAVERPRARVLKGKSLVPALVSLPELGFTKKLLGRRVAVAVTAKAPAAVGVAALWSALRSAASSSGGTAWAAGSSGSVGLWSPQPGRPATARAKRTRMARPPRRRGCLIVG